MTLRERQEILKQETNQSKCKGSWWATEAGKPKFMQTIISLVNDIFLFKTLKWVLNIYLHLCFDEILFAFSVYLKKKAFILKQTYTVKPHCVIRIYLGDQNSH